MTTLTISDDLGKRLAEFAAKEQLSVDELAAQVLEEFLFLETEENLEEFFENALERFEQELDEDASPADTLKKLIFGKRRHH